MGGGVGAFAYGGRMEALERVVTPTPPIPNAGEGRLQGPFGLSRSEADALARRIVEDHRKGKAAAFGRMLTAQKYAFHIHGEGDAQWADIVGGRQVQIPKRRDGALRHQDNILRPMVDYWVSYFCGQTFRTVAQHRADRRSRDFARIDTIVANQHIDEQQLNLRTMAAMYMASFNGFGILHSQWRNDVIQTGSETQGSYAKSVAYPGFTDVFEGNPFDTIFAPSATRHSIPWISYGRTLPASLVRQAFADVPDIEKVEGSDREPSTNWFQRMIREWTWLWGGTAGAHGTSTLTGSGGSEENIALICREVMPGQYAEFPQGMLAIVGLRGASDTDSRGGQSAGNPILLHVGPLPGGVLSATLFHALVAGDDVRSKAYVADLDDDQVRLNQAITMYAAILSQYAYPQLFVPQGTQLLENQTIGDKIIEYIQNPGSPPPQYQFPGSGTNFGAILQFIGDIRNSAFRKGGWQASSRGESSGANEPAARAQFLAAQDKMIFAPTALSFRGSLVDLLRKNHALRREYQRLPMLVSSVGDELGYLAEEYIMRESLSPTPPNFQLVSGFGASSEERLSQLNELVVLRGGDGQPILPTKRYWSLHPDQGLRPNEPDAQESRNRRAQAINVYIETVVEEFMEQNQGVQVSGNPQVIAQLSAQVWERYPPVWSDGNVLPALVESLDILIQDPSVDPGVRDVAVARQEYLLQWQMQAAGQMAGAGGQPQGGQPQAGQPQAGQLSNPEQATANAVAAPR